MILVRMKLRYYCSLTKKQFIAGRLPQTTSCMILQNKRLHPFPKMGSSNWPHSRPMEVKLLLSVKTTCFIPTWQPVKKLRSPRMVNSTI